MVMEWLKSKWQGIAVGLILGILCSTGFNHSTPTQVTATAGATQNVTGTAASRSGAVIEIPGRPATPCPESKVCPECPPVRIVYDCSSSVAGNVTQSSSATAKVELDKQGLALWVGGGVTTTNFALVNGGYVEAALGFGSLQVPLRYELPVQRASVGVSYRLF